MFTIKELAQLHKTTEFLSILDEESMLHCFISATVDYRAWGELAAANRRWDDENNQFIRDQIVVNEDTVITSGELGVIKPLAMLYMERQVAMANELSRNHMHEQAGRSSSEVEQEIAMYRNDNFRRYAFYMPPMTI